jgi:hypothetical protein
MLLSAAKPLPWVPYRWAGREKGCGILYGVIAIGVVYQEMSLRFGHLLDEPGIIGDI